jgi:hypothetical protein
VLVGCLEAGDPVDGGGEQDPVPVLGGGDAEPDRHMRLAGAGRTGQHDVLGFGDALGGGQVGDGVAAESGLVVEAELLDRLAGWEPGRPDAQLGAG